MSFENEAGSKEGLAAVVTRAGTGPNMDNLHLISASQKTRIVLVICAIFVPEHNFT
jgi:hypothetical protein